MYGIRITYWNDEYTDINFNSIVSRYEMFKALHKIAVRNIDDIHILTLYFNNEIEEEIHY